MGYLLNEKWVKGDSSSQDFRRQESLFRNWITVNGEAGPNGENGFKAEKGRYHLYVSLACPWAHRTLIYRSLMQLEDYIDVTVVDPLMLDNGWQMLEDPLYGFDFMYELYLKAYPKYEGRVTVPVLWDKKTQTIVSNESADIIRMFNSGFNHLTGCTDNYYPGPLQDKIESLNSHIFSTINTGVYKAGFSRSQEAYEEAVENLFSSLDWLEETLRENRYLTGNQLTEADWRLFPTLLRFDAVYFGHFKCNVRRLSDYPAISAYARELFQIPGIADTVNFTHIKQHYYLSHREINPSGIVPEGLPQDFMAKHGREGLSKEVSSQELHPKSSQTNTKEEALIKALEVVMDK
jgi:putative glutathione S-transferase